MTTGMIGKREKMLDGLTKWLNVGQMTDALKEARDHLCRYKEVMIAYAKQQGT